MDHLFLHVQDIQLIEIIKDYLQQDKVLIQVNDNELEYLKLMLCLQLLIQNITYLNQVYKKTLKE